MPIARGSRGKARTGARFVRAEERSQISDRRQGLSVEAVRMFAISDNPCTPFARIVKHGRDFEAPLKLPQLRKAMKAALYSLSGRNVCEQRRTRSASRSEGRNRCRLGR
jgi:hypothetical protein